LYFSASRLFVHGKCFPSSHCLFSEYGSFLPLAGPFNCLSSSFPFGRVPASSPCPL